MPDQTITGRDFKRVVKVRLYRLQPLPDDVFTDEKSNTNAIEIDKLRIQFEIDRDLSKHPNRCDVKITNLSQRMRSELERKPLRLELEAGHDNIYRLLFVGDVRYVSSVQEGADWITKLDLGDGSRVLTRARVSKSYAKGTTVKKMIQDTLGAMGQRLPDNLANDTSLDVPVQTGGTVFGKASDELERILAPLGYRWSIQNNKVMILRDDELNGGLFLINENAGMIGSPEFGDPPKKGGAPRLTVKTLLYPEIKPGHRVRVQSRAVNGDFKVQKISHAGDTHGDDWYSKIELKPTK